MSAVAEKWERKLRRLLPWLAAVALLLTLWNQQVTEPPKATVSGQWETLTGCTLAEDARNDGDSFSVMHLGKRYVFRLYFMDCPEKERTRINGDRLKDQALDFGGITEEELIAGGQAAADFTLSSLRSRPFTVQTRWEQVYDSRRFYAIVTPADHAEDLAFTLARAGLARVHTTGTDLPDGTGHLEVHQTLLRRSQTARRAHRGLWQRKS